MKIQLRFIPFYLTLLALVASLLGAALTTPPARAASIVVNTDADNTTAGDGFCTLREAITNADTDTDTTSGDCSAGTGPDTITFADDYTITLVGSQLPAITTEITINGNGAANTILQANAAANTATYRVFQVASTGIFTLNDVTVRHGRCDGSCAGGGGFVNIGGGILSEGETNINNSVISNNIAAGGGGGIYHSYQYLKKLTIEDSILNSNISSTNGGAIFTNGLLDISNSTFENNSAFSGGAIAKFGTPVSSLSGLVFFNNSATNHGGAIYLWSASNVTITNTDFEQNAALEGSGGGIHNDANSPTITTSTFRNNNAWFGGGGISNWSGSNPVLTNLTLSGNSARYGGGMYNYDTSSPTLTNITFSGNSASLNGGGMFNYWENSSPTLTNVIIANSTSGGDCVNGSHALNPASSNNLVESTGANACGLVNGNDGNIIGQDPNLGPLANNGGATQTHALMAGSPAIDTGTNTGCPATDQRGVMRPQGSACDVGAYEKLGSPYPTFADVPVDSFGWAHIESIYAAGITGGCTTSPLNYCPGNSVTRAQMAIFLLRGIHGSSYAPPAPAGDVFSDVPSTAFAAAWIEQLFAEGITGGCGGGNYCPNNPVTRAQMAIFLLRAKYGSDYTPPPPTGVLFDDIPANAFAAAWIEQLAAEGITSGCGGGNYCPNNTVTRAQMAVFIQKTFALPLP